MKKGKKAERIKRPNKTKKKRKRQEHVPFNGIVDLLKIIKRNNVRE